MLIERLFSQLYAADSVKNYGNFNVNRMMVVIGVGIASDEWMI